MHAVALTIPLSGILAIGASSVLMSDAVLEPSENLKQLALQIFTLLLVIQLANLTSSSPIKLLKGVVWILCIASVMGIAFTMAGMTPLDIIRSIGLDTTSEFAEQLVGLADVRFLGLARAQGFFAHPIEYGATLVLAFATVRTRPEIVRLRYLRWIVYSILLLGVFFSGSRGAWLGVVFAEVILRYLRSDKTKRMLFATVTASLVLVLLATNFAQIASYVAEVESSTNPLDKSLAARLVDYEVVVESVAEHPTGVGYANWGNYAQVHAPALENQQLDDDYLRFYAEGGLLGLLVYLVFVFRGLLPLPYMLAGRDRSLVILLTFIYAWQALTYTAFAFQAYTIVHGVLLTIALRLPRSFK